MTFPGKYSKRLLLKRQIIRDSTQAFFALEINLFSAEGNLLNVSENISTLKTFSLIQRLIKCHSVKTRVLSLIYSGHSKINIFRIYESRVG